jgi:2,4-dienoyl-CoA reductase-like NADH-dependent reductase (Old Yellow Enzyme family)
MKMAYERLFSGGEIGGLTLKNRVFMTAAGCALCEEGGVVTEGLLAYYEARARGGVGAIVTEVVRVNEETGVMNAHQLCATGDRHIGEIRKLADRLRPYGCRLFLQLHHPGNVTHPGLLGGRRPVSASGLPSLMSDQAVDTLDTGQIRSIVNDFGDAARRVQEAGADGVEIHGAHFYLLHQFLTPLFNKRTDEYGGGHGNRMRFLKEVVADVQAKCGRDFPLLVRISVEDYMGERGYHLDEGVKICQDLEAMGVHAIDVTCAGAGCPGRQSLEPASFPQGWRKHLGAAVKELVGIPVVSVAPVRDPAFAEELLAQGQLDFVGSARCHIADPEWAAKARDGRDSEIRRCISCLKCIRGIQNGLPISSAVNHVCGREGEAGRRWGISDKQEAQEE